MSVKSLKADLHAHSKYSTRPSQWVLQKIGCSESYTEPLALYKTARERGMDLVTITDHNSLRGSLEIAHLKGAFVSEEITTYFPEDKCKLHVLAYDVTEKQHEDITRLREDVFELVPYLRSQNIAHAVAHPLYSPNERLTMEHFEQMLLLFNIFEQNGARDDAQNEALGALVQLLQKEDLELLADKRGIEPYGENSWQKTLIGGSDDHSSLHIASKYTEVTDAKNVVEFLRNMTLGKTQVRGHASNPKKLAHTLYSIAYQFYGSKFGLGRYVSRDLLLKFANRVLTSSAGEEEHFLDRIKCMVTYRMRKSFSKTNPLSMKGLTQQEARNIIFGDPVINGAMNSPKRDPEEMVNVWHRFVDQVSKKILRQFADSALESLSGANLFDIFQKIGSAGALYTMLAPYFVSYTLFSKGRLTTQRLKEHFNLQKEPAPDRELNVGHFTDTFFEVNGVAKTLRMQVKFAQKNKQNLTMITCGPEPNAPGVVNFQPIGMVDLPEYPEMKLYYPPLLEMLDYCYENEINLIHAATPGPIGLAALAIARILKLPIHGTYHTALPQYVSELTSDAGLEEAAWSYMIWFYNQMDTVFVPSLATGNELISKGIHEEKVRFYPRGIDTERFHPAKRNGFLETNYEVQNSEFKLLYVGRVSKEKNLPKLVEVFKKVSSARKKIHLVVVGEGPYLEEMKLALRGTPVTFTGYLSGEDLAEAYASSDLFIFPSTTDTFGNVVLEAQASGLPVIVSDQGGPMENLIDGETGHIIPAEDVDAYVKAILNLADNPDTLRTMKDNARKYVEKRSFEAAYLEQWKLYDTEMDGMKAA